MPRTGWLACGAIGAALALQAHGGASGVVALGFASLALVAGALLASASGRRALVLLALGAALVLGRAALSPPGADAGRAAEPAGNDVHRATVVTLYAPSGGMQRAILELDSGPGAGQSVYATLPRYPAVAPPDVVEFGGRLEPAPPAEESGFAEFLARSRIAWTVRARTLSALPSDATPAAGLEDIRRAAGNSLARTLPEPQAGLAAAIVIGLRDMVAREVAADFRTSGLSHVVAISGFHVALLAALAGVLLRPLARRPRSFALLALLAGYALLAGASPSVLRATAMTGTVLVLRIGGRRGHAAAALGMAVLLLLIAEPATVGEVGFQLSVAATAGLLRWASPFAAWLGRRLPAALPQWLVEALGVSLAAQLATLPLVLLHFGRLSLVAPLSNLLATPLVAPAMAGAGLSLGAGGLAAAGVPEVLLAPVHLAGALAIGALIAVARVCAALPLASVELGPPLDLLAAAFAGLVVLLMLRRPAAAASEPVFVPPARPGGGVRHRRRLALAGAVAALVLVAGLVVGARPDGRLHMTVLDVGQGDAILLVGARGSRMLVDAGPDPDRLIALLDARLPAWDRRLDLVVVTHPHEDHIAGLGLLFDRYRIGAVAEPGMIGLGPGDAEFRRRLAERGQATRILAAGDTFDFDGARVTVRWPLAGRVPERPSDGGKQVNNVSIVLDLIFGARRLLLTGDVEEEIDAHLVSGGLAGERPVDVLKVAHHGSATATTGAFLERVSPRVAVISAGLGNRYGHPSPATVARLEAAGARVLRTDVDGSVSISTDGADLRVAAEGARAVAALPPEAVLAGGPGFCPLPRPAPGARSPPYNRSDGGPLAPPGGSPAARSRAARVAVPPLRRGCRGGRLPRRARRAAGPAGRPAGGRDGRTAARSGQGAAGR